jgi:NRAMP (natural resistance-associated macrophage protein)-like metal ion transporter
MKVLAVPMASVSRVVGNIRMTKAFSLRRKARSVALLDQLGPGLITGAADDDPSGIATYSQAGAQAGYSLLWTLFLTYPLMVAIQLVSARIGRVTGSGLAKNMAAILPRPLVMAIVVLLFIANTINLGADLAAMGSVSALALGGMEHLYTVGFAILSLLLQMFIPYRRYANFLKWLTLVLFAYVAVLFIVKVDWPAALGQVVAPQLNWSRSATIIVAIFGTTISPYLFFWQSAQEVEEIDAVAQTKALVTAPRQAKSAFARIKIDTFSGMAISNLIALAIMISTAATLHMSGHTNIQTATDAAKALEPIAGHFAFALFSIGIVGTGLLAIPVLAGSAAYAVGDAQGWKCGLDNKPWEAVGFYSVIAAACALGLGIDYCGFDPMLALFWSAVVNGVIAVPIMVALMLVASSHRQMGRFAICGSLAVVGWISTAVMAAAAVAMFAFWS